MAKKKRTPVMAQEAQEAPQPQSQFGGLVQLVILFGVIAFVASAINNAPSAEKDQQRLANMQETSTKFTRATSVAVKPRATQRPTTTARQQVVLIAQPTNTSRPTETALPTLRLTSLPAGSRPTTAPTQLASQRVTASTETYYATRNANVRSCAQTTCPLLKTIVAGEAVEVVGTEDGEAVGGSREWFEIVTSSGTGFIHSSLVSENRQQQPAPTQGGGSGGGGAQQATAVPTTGDFGAANTSVPPPVISTEVPQQISWDCSGNYYNCSRDSFPDMNAMYSYFNFCKAQGAGDPSHLDHDDDNDPCERGLE